MNISLVEELLIKHLLKLITSYFDIEFSHVKILSDVDSFIIENNTLISFEAHQTNGYINHGSVMVTLKDKNTIHQHIQFENLKMEMNNV